MGVKDALLTKLLRGSDNFTDEQVSQTIDMLVTQGVSHRATDIHIEPQDRVIQVRYRIDGNLRCLYKLPITTQAAIIRQIKLLAHLDETKDYAPQEGRYAA